MKELNQYGLLPGSRRVTTMRVKNGGSACHHEWVVNGHIQGYGDPVDVMFTTLGVNEVLLRYRRGKGRSSAAATETLGVRMATLRGEIFIYSACCWIEVLCLLRSR
jgi:hypothetical protein